MRQRRSARVGALAGVAILVAALVGSVAPVAAATAIATPTHAELAVLTSDVNAYYTDRVISSAGLYSTLSSDLSSASAALDRGNTKAATNAVQKFISDTNAQSGKKIAAWAASVLTSIAKTGTAPSSTVVPLSPTAPTSVTTQVTGPSGGIQDVSIALPAGLAVGGVAVASVTISAPTASLGAFPSVVSAVEIDAADAFGNELHSFDSSATVGVTLSLPASAPQSGLVAVADDPITGSPHSLPLAVNSGRTAATITTPHFSTFEIGVPAASVPSFSIASETSGTAGTLRGISCSSSTLCTAVGDGGVMARYDGSSWQSVITSVGNLTGVACDATACHVTGADGSVRTAGPSTFAPEAGTPATGNPALRGITCAGGTCVAVGDGGTILYSTGSGWAPVASGTTNNLNAVGCWSNGASPPSFECAAVGDNGTVLTSTNPTASWFVEASPSGSPNLYGTTCVAAVECHGVGAGGFVGPGTQSSGTTMTLRAVACKGAGQCLAVGDGGTIVYTSDGGTNWSTASSGVTDNLNGAECLGTTCRVVGVNGTILRVT